MNPRFAFALVPAALFACGGASSSDLFSAGPPSSVTTTDTPDAGTVTTPPVQQPPSHDAGAPPHAVVDAGSGTGPVTIPDASADDDATAPPPDAAPPPDDAAPPISGEMQTVQMTFYGWNDNTPPGDTIAYPKNAGYPTVHDTAGGTGTYADPVTLASDVLELPAGTLVYAPVIEKYLVMEDDCGACDTDWSTAQTWHVNVWMNSSASDTASALSACEGAWSQSATTIEIDPPAGRTVSTKALFDPTNDKCRTSP